MLRKPLVYFPKVSVAAASFAFAQRMLNARARSLKDILMSAGACRDDGRLGVSEANPAVSRPA